MTPYILMICLCLLTPSTAYTRRVYLRDPPSDKSPIISNKYLLPFMDAAATRDGSKMSILTMNAYQDLCLYRRELLTMTQRMTPILMQMCAIHSDSFNREDLMDHLDQLMSMQTRSQVIFKDLIAWIQKRSDCSSMNDVCRFPDPELDVATAELQRSLSSVEQALIMIKRGMESLIGVTDLDQASDAKYLPYLIRRVADVVQRNNHENMLIMRDVSERFHSTADRLAWNVRSG